MLCSSSSGSSGRGCSSHVLLEYHVGPGSLRERWRHLWDPNVISLRHVVLVSVLLVVS